MTERFPEQRNRSAQRRADADQVSASAPGDAVFPADAAYRAEPAFRADTKFRDDPSLVFDESFVAAAPAREPSAQARALLARRSMQLRQDGAPHPARETLGRWSVRPSHHLAAVRLLPVLACAVGLSGLAALLFVLLH